MIGVTYSVNGQIIGDCEPTDTPFVNVDLVIGWWHALTAVLRREAITVRVTVEADEHTAAAVQNLLDTQPSGDELLDAAAGLETAKQRLRAARRRMNKALDAVNAAKVAG